MNSYSDYSVSKSYSIHKSNRSSFLVEVIMAAKTHTPHGFPFKDPEELTLYRYGAQCDRPPGVDKMPSVPSLGSWT